MPGNIGASGKLRVRVQRANPTLWQKIKGEGRSLDKPPRITGLLDKLNPFSGPARMTFRTTTTRVSTDKKEE